MIKKHINIAKKLMIEQPVFHLTAKENNDRKSFTHLRWMLEEVVSDKMSDTKASRWLGYVQGILLFKGLGNYDRFVDIKNINIKGDSDIVSHLIVVEQYLDDEKGIDILPKHSQIILEKFHIRFLINMIQKNEWHQDDANRILGIVQGILCCVDYIDVEEERNRTRALFNGE